MHVRFVSGIRKTNYEVVSIIVERKILVGLLKTGRTGYVMVTNQAPTLHERVRFLHPVLEVFWYILYNGSYMKIEQ